METRHHQCTDGARLIIEGEFLMFHRFADSADDIMTCDLDEITTSMMAWTQRGKTFVENGIFGYARLRSLPRLRELHFDTKLLDVSRLAAINRTLCVLPADFPEQSWAVVDDALVAMFTKLKPGASLPSVWTITNRLRRLIARLDASVNFDRKKRARREASSAPSVNFFPANSDGEDRAGLTLITDNATMSCIEAAVKAAAREHKLSFADTLIKLIAGEISTSVRPVLNLYSPRQAGAPVYFPGFGWSTASDLETLHRLFDATPPTINDLDAARSARTESYTPTKAMADYVRLRDGTCVYPGCHKPAEACQLDHRIPFGDGGPTTPDNLFCLCQHHHNLKTDRRGFYLPDPYTGETVWLFADGTWLISEDKGILGDMTLPDNPRWATTVSNNYSSWSRTARFNAQCHTLCDRYEEDGDYEACIAGIRALEEEYKLHFEFTPLPEDTSWIPPEPYLDEPPFPDPIDMVDDGTVLPLVA
ncbi:HNH endonuclease signature motif containing protein [Corynebacterium sp. LK2510]|uniref:HNH endonuclease signature motif containing protein n=1 Tax=Corynebacterium sp. LK2510 TaxID=3110472 RepID=UPI0034CDD0AF